MYTMSTMKRPLAALALLVTSGALAIWWLNGTFHFEKREVVSLTGFLFVLSSLILVFFFQLQSTRAFERRRATHDFMHGAIVSHLLPLERELKEAIKVDGVPIKTLAGLKQVDFSSLSADDAALCESNGPRDSQLL